MRGERISVHELTALRVDVSGERGRQPMPRSRKQVSASRDIAGNVVAVRPFKRKRYTVDILSSGEAPGDTVEQADKTLEVKSRSKKRRRDSHIHGLLPFINPPEMRNETLRECSSTSCDDFLPSSDLLKVIHHFSATYYDDRGILTAASRIFRSSRRPGRHRVKEGSTPEIEDEEDSSETESVTVSQSLAPRKADSFASSSPGPPSRKVVSRALKNDPEEVNSSRSTKSKDMFRAFDGSTLLLIGMLLQSHIEYNLDRAPPILEEWTERMQKDEEEREKRSRRGRKKRFVEPGLADSHQMIAVADEADEKSNEESSGEGVGPLRLGVYDSSRDEEEKNLDSSSVESISE